MENLDANPQKENNKVIEEYLFDIYEQIEEIQTLNRLHFFNPGPYKLLSCL